MVETEHVAQFMGDSREQIHCTAPSDRPTVTSGVAVYHNVFEWAKPRSEPVEQLVANYNGRISREAIEEAAPLAAKALARQVARRTSSTS